MGLGDYKREILREDLIRKIDKLVESGDFGSRGEFVQYAVGRFP